MKPKLIVVGGDAKPSEIDLTLPSVIGRGRSVAVTLPHPLVSREHCEIYLNEGRLHVRDLGSLNGTYVGNERIEDVVLPAGGLLTVGTVTFRAVYEDPAAAVAEDDLSFSIADSESDDLTVGPDEPLSSRTTAMLTPGGVNDGDAESVESETESLERILESLGTSPSKEVELNVSPSADQDESEDSAKADDESDSTDARTWYADADEDCTRRQRGRPHRRPASTAQQYARPGGGDVGPGGGPQGRNPPARAEQHVLERAMSHTAALRMRRVGAARAEMCRRPWARRHNLARGQAGAGVGVGAREVLRVEA